MEKLVAAEGAKEFTIPVIVGTGIASIVGLLVSDRTLAQPKKEGGGSGLSRRATCACGAASRRHRDRCPGRLSPSRR
jgi:hypothetical protein